MRRRSAIRRWLGAFVLGAAAWLAWAADAPRGPDGLLAVPPPARVTDYAGVLSPQDRRALEDKLAAFEMAHGAQVAVLIVPSTQPEPIEDFAHRVGEAWKIGRAGIGDGVLVIVARDDRRLRIDVARSLEGALPDVTARRIGREIMGPHFQRGDYAAGLSAGLDAIFRQIEAEGLPPPAPSAGDVEADRLALVVPFIAVGFVVGVILRRIFGIPGALAAAGGTGVAAAKALASGVLGALAGLAVFALAVGGGSRARRVVGGRRGGVFIPGGWSGGGSGGGGWTPGGGGDFSGGGATSDW